MAKVVLSLDGRILDQRIVADTRLVIGRDADCDLVIPVPEVSARHAEIAPVVHDHFIEDLGSTNGTLVNGQPVSRHLLQNGDVVFLGPYRLKYLNVVTGAGLDRTQLLDPALIGEVAVALPGVAVPLDAASAAAHAARDRLARGRVSGEGGQYEGQEIPIERVLLPVGTRGICLAVINRRPAGCFLTHVGGEVRVRLNGKALGAEPALLKDGDVIEAGADRLVFHPD